MHGREWITEGAARTGEPRILAALWTEMLIGAAYTAVTVNRTEKSKFVLYFNECRERNWGGVGDKVPFYIAHIVFIVGPLARQVKEQQMNEN